MVADVATTRPRRARLAAPAAHGRSPKDAGHLAVRAALLAGGVAVAALWWLGTIPGSVSDLGDQVTAVGRITGLLGAYLVLVQVLLMARLPWFEAAVGLDRLAAWHRGLGTNVVILLSAHVLLTVEGYSLTGHHATLSEGWTVLTTYPDMLKATVGLALFLLVGFTSATWARRRLRYEAWYLVHLGSYLAIALAFFHQTSTGADFVGGDPRHVAARGLWTGMYLVVAVAVFCWRIVLPARGWLRHAMLVDQVVPEADGVVSVWVRGRRLDELGGRAGQFLLWRFITPGHVWTAHPYSLSAVPTPHRLRLTVKNAGDHSGAVAHLRTGVPILAEGPFGHFTAAAAQQQKVLLIAGGSGIGPIRALAEELSGPRLPRGGQRRGADVLVLYRASREADLALADELDALAAEGRIRVRYLVGRRLDLGFDPLGRGALSRLVPDVGQRDVFVCGPAEMNASVRDTLLQLRVPRRRIHVEEFSLA
ncbi:MAG: oxidoreductase FAD/NAD(P)-binding [Blastococcus sp.]|jgi:predicted ferric reductase|nr:oxidoreductase FAD/NAD(P)-binding [Blastococcus sp.]